MGTIYVLDHRDHCGVVLRNLDSEPGGPAGLILVSEWALWQTLSIGAWRRLEFG